MATETENNAFTNSHDTSSSSINNSSAPPKKIKKANTALHFLAGGIGGTVGAVVTCPLEVVKTRLQSSLYRNQNKNLFNMLRSIYLSEGVTGLWRGLLPNLVGVIPARSIYFSTYASTKHYLTHDLNGGKESPLIHLLSAVAAGVATSTFTNPIWLIKTRMQLQSDAFAAKSLDSASSPSLSRTGSATIVSSAKRLSSPQYFASTQREKISMRHISSSSAPSLASVAPTLQQSSAMPYYSSSFDCLKKVIQQEGFRGLFRGLTASYLGILEGTMQWLIYEQLKKVSVETTTATTNSSTTTSNGYSSSSGSVSNRQKSASFQSFLSGTFLAAGSAKFAATLITYPHEVLRTRLRQAVSVEKLVDGNMLRVSAPKYKGIRDVLKTVLKEEGLLAFYGGLTAHLLRTVPNSAIMFLCYETVVYLADNE